MNKKILSAKHWQLFTLMFIIPIVFIVFGENIISNTLSKETFIYLKKFFQVLNIVVLFSWIWEIFTTFQNGIIEKTKNNRFKIFFFISLIYLIIYNVFLENIIGRIEHNQKRILLSLHILSIFGIIHSIYFAAKSFKTYKLNKRTKFMDFIGDFFLLLIYPIGIWIMQPKINDLLKKTTANNGNRCTTP